FGRRLRAEAARWTLVLCCAPFKPRPPAGAGFRLRHCLARAPEDLWRQPEFVPAGRAAVECSISSLSVVGPVSFLSSSRRDCEKRMRCNHDYPTQSSPGIGSSLGGLAFSLACR